MQRKMTKIIEGIRNFSYERRLKLLKLHLVVIFNRFGKKIAIH